MTGTVKVMKVERMGKHPNTLEGYHIDSKQKRTTYE
jgi:hypothetical protein